MTLEKDKHKVLWPEYFNARLSRLEGRMVNSALAIDNPLLDELETAVKKLGLQYVVEPFSSYPRFQWKKSGRIVVVWKDKKCRLLTKVAEKLKELRTQPAIRASSHSQPRNNSNP